MRDGPLGKCPPPTKLKLCCFGVRDEDGLIGGPPGACAAVGLDGGLSLPPPEHESQPHSQCERSQRRPWMTC